MDGSIISLIVITICNLVLSIFQTVNKFKSKSSCSKCCEVETELDMKDKIDNVKS